MRFLARWVALLGAILAAVEERWGGAAGFLGARGWSDADVQRLRDRLTR